MKMNRRGTYHFSPKKEQDTASQNVQNTQSPTSCNSAIIWLRYTWSTAAVKPHINARTLRKPDQRFFNARLAELHHQTFPQGNRQKQTTILPYIDNRLKTTFTKRYTENLLLIFQPPKTMQESMILTSGYNFSRPCNQRSITEQEKIFNLTDDTRTSGKTHERKRDKSRLND